MVQRYLRSRTIKRIKIKTTKRTAPHYRRKKPKQARCSICNDFLKGIPRGNNCEIKKLPKTKKRPERPYGGVLCSKCSRKKIMESIQ